MLETAIENGARFGVDRLLKKDQGKINHPSENGQTPLMTAPWNGHKDIVDLLIHRGADVNHRTSSSAGPIGSRRTALALVIEKHRPRNVGILRQQDDHLASVAKLLLEQDGIDLTDEVNGIPMLKMAIGKGVVAVVDQLLDAYELDEDEREYTIEIGLEAFLERWKRAGRQYEKQGKIGC